MSILPARPWTWIESLGGPLVLLPGGLPWGGCPLDAEPLDPRHDYGRACATTDYAELVRAGPGTALVLGDEPMPTAWVPSNVGGWLVRWMFAPDEAAAIDVFGRRSRPERGHLFWRVSASPCGLFDSVHPAGSARERTVVALPAGTYRVSTVVEERLPDATLVLHELRRQGRTRGAGGG